MLAIGIDLGGTNIKGVLVNESGEILKQNYIPTQDSGNASWRNTIAEMVSFFENYEQKSISLVGLSAPGLPDENNRCIAVMPGRLEGLENFIWSDFLQKNTFVINDADAALLAEARFGVAKGRKNVVLLTLGTGVGGGILINGELYQGFSQRAGHFGHITLNSEDDDPNIVGMPGSLEYAIGNYSVSKRTHAKYNSTWELLEGYRKKESLATWVWLHSVRKLALAICSISNSLAPEMVVLAGGITLANEDLFEPLKTFMDLYEWRPDGKQIEVVQAHFGDMAGAIGAAGFAQAKSMNNYQ